jgi:hypothetical protein
MFDFRPLIPTTNKLSIYIYTRARVSLIRSLLMRTPLCNKSDSHDMTEKLLGEIKNINLAQ